MIRGTFTRLTVPTMLPLALVVVTCMNTLGCAIVNTVWLTKQVGDLYAQGKYNDAIPLAQRALSLSEELLGRDSPPTARMLNNLAELYRISGSYTKAEPLYQRALKILEQKQGANHPDTAMVLNNLALLYIDTGAYTKAEPLHQRALAIREQVLGQDHPHTAASLNNLGMLYRATGPYTKAESLYERALRIYEQALGREHPDTAMVLNNLALLYIDTGAYTKAEPLHQRALAIREQVLGQDHPDTATSLNNLAEFYFTTGAYTKAEPLHQRALAIREQALGRDHPDTAASLINLANLYGTTGAYTKAEPLYQRALAIREQALGRDHPDTAMVRNNLALLYIATGAYTKAEPLYQGALKILEQELGADHPGTAVSLNNLADLYSITGAYTKAEPLYQRALAIRERALGRDHPDTAASLNNLANLYGTTGAYTKAEPLYQRALAIHEQALGRDHPNTATSLNNLAELYRLTGDYTKAEPLHQRALAIREQVLGQDHPDIAASLNNLANLYGTIGAYTKAEPLYQRALVIHEQALGPDHLRTAMSLTNLAFFRWAVGNPASTLSLLERAQTIQEKHAAEFLLTGSEVRKQAYVRQMYRNVFAEITFSLIRSNRPAVALGVTSVLQTKGRVLDAMSDSVARLRQSVKSEDRALFDQFAIIAQERSTLTHQGPGKLQLDAYHQRLNELAAEQERLENELSSRSAEFRQQVAPIVLASVQEAIPRGTALIEWFCYEPFDPNAKDERTRFGVPRYVAYVLRHEGEPAVVDLGEAKAIETLVQDFRAALSDPMSTYVHEVAMELSERLIKPLRPHLDNAERLLLSPDGALNLLPFAALLNELGEYLAQRVEITYLTSGRDLLQFGEESPVPGSDVVVADPDYGQSKTMVVHADPVVEQARSVDLDRGSIQFTPLSGTAIEAVALRDLLSLKEGHLLTQAKATEDRFKQLHGPRILHVATHGFFLIDNEVPRSALKTIGFAKEKFAGPIGENPLLRSGLALAGANQRHSGEKDDGILTAAEVAQMDLRGTQLVVLSACETGVGDVQNGEGVYGLRRALVLAGAESQVTSLWKVSDDATKDLMVDYYQRLLKGEGRSEALRKAQRTMMKSKDHSHPYYWAAFVPIGDWRPLKESVGK